MPPPDPLCVRVPASTSNLGVGFDCLGLALDRSLTACYEPGAGPLRLERQGFAADVDGPPEQDLLMRVFRARSAAGGREGRGLLRVDSRIPVGKGLGSSAAAVVAGLLLADAARGAPAAERPALLADAVAWEGHPDNSAPALYGGLVAIAAGEDGRAHPFPLPLAEGIGVAFAAPAAGLPTAAARAALPERVPHGAAARGLGRMAALVRGLETGDAELIRLGLLDELHVRHRLPLIPGAAAALAAAVEAGAWGATISGGGSGLVALGPPERMAAVADAMAALFREAEAGASAQRGGGTGAGAGGRGGIVAFAARVEREGARVLGAGESRVEGGGT